MTLYQYRKLRDASACIRVLRLSAGSIDSLLEASLETREMRERPQYEAISYYWGPNDKPKRILLRESGREYVLPITSNLDLALRRLRDPVQDRLLWTDAICINQRDKGEMGDQVRIMGKIYAAAAKVLVYLGETDLSLPKALKLLEKIHKSGNSALTDKQSNLQWVRDNKLPSVIDDWKWEPLKVFFRRPWFRRKWTIQESALASKLDFHCDTWTRDWEYMSLIIETIYDKGLAVQDYTTSKNQEEARQLQQGLSQINAIRLYRRGRYEGKNYPFLDLAHHFSVSEATDPRDHLFALLGIASDSGDKQLHPEYEHSTVLQICLRYAYYFLHRDQNLEVLYRAGLTGNKLLAPSWIPNWYGGHQTFGLGCNEGVWNPLLRPKHLNVSRGTRLCLTSDRKSFVLGVKGVVIDAIKVLASEYISATQDAWRSKDLILTQRRGHLIASDHIMSELQNYPTGEALDEVQWRTLMCNTTRSGTIPDKTFADVYAAWRRITFIPASVDQQKADFNSSLPFDLVFSSWNADKVFGLTNAGFVGMFPHHSRKEDVVVILYGGEFPFVLRPRKGSSPSEYELVGQCYVHGIMEESQLDFIALKSKEEMILLA